MRSLANPDEHDDPETYKGENWWTADESCEPSGCNDFCGVHHNSGIGNKMFYLLSEGGAFNGVAVAGIGAQNAMRIALAANRHHWHPSSDYADARGGMVRAAEAYDEANSTSYAESVRAAWTAVGVAPP